MSVLLVAIDGGQGLASVRRVFAHNADEADADHVSKGKFRGGVKVGQIRQIKLNGVE